jgi:flagellar hook-associated protein 3 FlgL
MTVASPLTFTVSDGLGVNTTINLSGSYDATTLKTAVNTALTASGANLNADVVDGSLVFRFKDSEKGGEMSFSQTTGDLKATLGISQGVKNVFGLLSDVEAAMKSQDVKEVSTLLGRIDKFNDALAGVRGQMGSRAKNLEFARDRTQQSTVNSTTLKETVEGIDLPETVTRLSAQQQAYQTALAAGSRIFNISILDYLR